MISLLNDMEQYLAFKALVLMIDSNAGIGFHNKDQGHPAYRLGATGQVGMGDSPDANALFKMLASFNKRLHGEGPDLSTWEKFCTYAVAAYDRKHR